ncbi:MAG: glycosyltransferase [Bacteroidota bacterium]|nr:glycosyltransferase [Bacteroidota bacterium]
MKILHAMPYPPVPPTFGGALRIYHLLQHMTRHHRVTVLTYGGHNEYRLLREHFGDRLQDIHLIPYPWFQHHRRLGQGYALLTKQSFTHLITYTKNMQRLIDLLLLRNEFDIVQSEFAIMGPFNFRTDAVKILDAHNVEYDNFRRIGLSAPSLLRRLYYRREYKAFFSEEIRACRKNDAIFVTSPRDKAILDNDVPEIPKYVIPNGVDTSYFTPAAGSAEPYSLVFTGMMGYVPNYEGMLYFLSEIFPLILKEIPQSKLYIVGSLPPKKLFKLASSNVIITGYVDDVRPFIQKSSVYVVPLRMGGGTRLKIIEAMAVKKPIVTTTIGCEGIEVQDGESVMVRDEPASFANAVVELLRDKQKSARLAARGYELVRARYDWSIISRRMEECYEDIFHRNEHRTIRNANENELERRIAVH